MILLCVRWYVRYLLSYRDREEMMRERGPHVENAMIYCSRERLGPDLPNVGFTPSSLPSTFFWVKTIAGLLSFLVGYGLWTLRGWAFWAVVILEALNLIFGAVLLFSAFNIWAVLLSMVIPAAILIYFFADSHVREAFHIG